MKIATFKNVETPDGAAYVFEWDDIRKELVVSLYDVGDRQRHTTDLVVHPRTPNTITMKPRER